MEYNLAELVGAFQFAVDEAKKVSDEQHIRQIKRYFAEDGSPLTVQLKVPDLNPSSGKKWREIELPLISMVPPTSIQMREMVAKFKVKLGEVEWDRENHPNMSVELEDLEGNEEGVSQVKLTFRVNQTSLIPPEVRAIPILSSEIPIQPLAEGPSLINEEEPSPKTDPDEIPEASPDTSRTPIDQDQAPLSAPPQEDQAETFGTTHVNINSATFEELEPLPMIGPVRAQRIIDYRNENGPFETIDDLKKVSGIGEINFEEVRNQITV